MVTSILRRNGEDDFKDEEQGLGSSTRSSDHGSVVGKSDDEDDDESSGDTTIKEQLTKKETQAVFGLRVIVILILIVKTIVITVVMYSISESGEKAEFNNQYEAAAEKIVASFEDIIFRMGAINGVGTQMTIHSVDHKAPWPTVTLSSFQQRAGNAKELSGALYVSIAHIVEASEWDKWDGFVNGFENVWMNESYTYQQIRGIDHYEYPPHIERSRLTNELIDPMHFFDESGTPFREANLSPFYCPVWQTSPLLRTNQVNENVFHKKEFKIALSHILAEKTAYVGGFVIRPPGNSTHPDPDTAMFASLMSIREEEEAEYLGDPMVQLYFPVFDIFDLQRRKVVAVLTSILQWSSYFQNILPSNINGIVVVLDNSCDADTKSHFTFLLEGHKAHVVGEGDRHDPAFDMYRREGHFGAETVEDGTLSGIHVDSTACNYHISIYPSREFYDDYHTGGPAMVATIVVCIYVLVILMFLFYDRLVERRQRIVLNKATQSTAIVSSLFPKTVRERLMETAVEDMEWSQKHRLKSFINGNQTETRSAAQIADLFPQCTVFFADIVGFTAWSSTREPSMVFVLLQNVYQAFDAAAKRRKVFKVETIGDSYMAVTGLPEAQPHHATIMVRFAFDALHQFYNITKDLENTLGPDTAELSMRLGMHSGPVTAGVLKGDRARFQLFGDTVNTAARMESTGLPGHIQVSETTAFLLQKAGKGSWLRPREDMVEAKGKGFMKTFFVDPVDKPQTSSTRDSSTGDEMGIDPSLPTFTNPVTDPVNGRLVNWITDLLLADIRKIIAHRRAHRDNPKVDVTSDFVYRLPPGQTCMDEVKEVIKMPRFNAKVSKGEKDPSAIEVDPQIVESLKHFVTAIASMYRANAFHSFDHAAHVTMSVSKLLSRIVAPDISSDNLVKQKQKDIALHLHDYSFGITSDPLTQFATTFSALIHDLDHRGVSNMQMKVEEPEMASKYNDKSIAEQNSLDMAWDILMRDQYRGLRRFIFGTESEMLRFRQIIVNLVLATDIFDKQLNDLRKARWTGAFSGDDARASFAGTERISDVRATIVLEHIIQASDVSHTMQHWHVYQKWNKRLLTEMYTAYKAGRMEKDPFSFWYRGEIGFFDNYIIPLAKKLEQCCVFGVSSDEYLNYALRNRAEWEAKGEAVVAQMKAKLTSEDQNLEATASGVGFQPIVVDHTR